MKEWRKLQTKEEYFSWISFGCGVVLNLACIALEVQAWLDIRNRISNQIEGVSSLSEIQDFIPVTFEFPFLYILILVIGIISGLSGIVDENQYRDYSFWAIALCIMAILIPAFSPFVFSLIFWAIAKV